MTLDVEWEFGNDGNSKKYKMDFHILKNAPAAVILSDDFPFETKAYYEYDCFLVDEDDEDIFFAIDFEPNYLDPRELLSAPT